MTDRLQTDINRGQQAKALLEHELLKEGFEKLKAEYLTAWAATKPHEEDYRNQLWYAHRVVDLVRRHLTNIVNDGTLAQAELDAMRRPKPTLSVA